MLRQNRPRAAIYAVCLLTRCVRLMEPCGHTQEATIRTPTLCHSRPRIAALCAIKHQHANLPPLYSRVTFCRGNKHPLASDCRPATEATDITSQGEIVNQHPCRARTTDRSHPRITRSSHSPILTERATSTCDHGQPE